MTILDTLKGREAALLSDRARVDEQLRDIRAAISGAEAIIAEAQAAQKEAAQAEDVAA